MLAIALICLLAATVVFQASPSALAQNAQPEPQVRTIGIDGLVDLMKSGHSYVLVDARSREAYDQAHLPGAVSIPLSVIGSYADRYDKNSTIVVYCNSYECPISAEAAKEFMRLGFVDVRDYKGGLQEWNERGYPVYGR